MNTPAHSIVNLLVLARKNAPQLHWPIAVGGILPDVPMFGFYAYQKLVLGTPERILWGERYFDPSWQGLFDVFNSLPILSALVLAAYLKKSPFFVALWGSMILHSLCDLPLHHDDAHRHFYPLSDFRFRSPVSYWDPAHYGWITVPIEALTVLTGSVWLSLRMPGRGPQNLPVARVLCVRQFPWFRRLDVELSASLHRDARPC